MLVYDAYVDDRGALNVQYVRDGRSYEAVFNLVGDKLRGVWRRTNVPTVRNNQVVSVFEPKMDSVVSGFRTVGQGQ